MAAIPSYKRINTKDYSKDDQSLVEQLGEQINDGFSAIYFSMAGKITLAENIYCTVAIVDVTVNSAGIPTVQTSFRLKNQVPVLGCQVISCVNQTNTASYPTGAPFISFTQLDTSLLINHITGLQPNQRYTLRIIAWN